jgi:hypothetical protein
MAFRAEKLKEGLQVIIRAVETALRQGLIGVQGFSRENLEEILGK